MTGKAKKLAAVTLLGALLSGCVSADQIDSYSAAEPGFASVAGETSRRMAGKSTVWIQNADQARATADRVHGLVFRKTITADTAVQVALLNNRGLQSAYAELGMSAADAWQETMLENPVVSIGLLGIAAPEVNGIRTLEGMVAANLLSLSTRKRRVDIADIRFRQSQASAVEATLALASQTRRAWIEAVAAFETVTLLNQAQAAADAASELAQKLGETGAMPKAAQAREHAFYAELTGQKAQARLAAQLAKEQLTRLMGLWGDDTNYFVPDALPRLPGSPRRIRAVESDALRGRIDLQIAKLELEAVAQSYKLTNATRYVSDLELIAGVEAEREIETEYELDGGSLEEHKSKKTVATPQIELEFAIPLFDSGKASLRKAEFAYMQAANRLAEKAVTIRSEARSSYTAYQSTHKIARHYRDAVLPLRKTVEAEALLTYNGMITSTFDLLADTRARINTALLASDAKRAFWISEADLAAAIVGGGVAASAGGAAPQMTAEAGGGGH
ncbi:TolC family protein [Roseibium suaedae]|uniref:Outer membrane protein TolC n=1 Tax=Roseibium suaedae TaxID=735517 RepID=A0A1M7P0Q2_9HYPH|nr:TolC family protein [Roseibium suaedae]SHN10033.1 Outer membrane protein TolC [Roseibium suaedae]